MFKLRARIIDLETGSLPIVTINESFAKKNDIHGMERVEISCDHAKIVAVVNISEKMLNEDEIGLFEETWKKLKIKEGEIVNVVPVGKPESTKYIRKKMDREELFDEEIKQIVKDIVDEKLTDVELVAFVSSAYMNGMTLAETTALTKYIVETGGKLNLKKKPILDKHCIGGVAGNRTTMVLVPIVASLGFTIPKTSSRSITSPAGTADTMEVLANVSFSIEELQDIVKKVGGCIVWGGAINLAAADDKLIKVRHPLSLDPEGMMLASIVAKKLAVGATHVIFDLPIGEEAKLKYIGEARHLEREFKSLTNNFGMKMDTVITDGSSPIGRGVGPLLEARDVLWLLRKDKKGPNDLKEKVTMLTGKLLELTGKYAPGTGKTIAEKQINNGAAYKKFMEIIEAQGGNPKIKPEDLTPGKYTLDYKAEKRGEITNMKNSVISKIARAAGCPATPEAGIYLYKNYGDNVKEGEKVFTVYAQSERNIDNIVKILKEMSPVTIE